MKLAFFLLLSTLISSPSVASFMPECNPPSRAISDVVEADAPSLEYLQTMIRIELEGKAVAARVLRGALGPQIITRKCGSELGDLIALAPHE
jgi:hypothetical protein